MSLFVVICLLIDLIIDLFILSLILIGENVNYVVPLPLTKGGRFCSPS